MIEEEYRVLVLAEFDQKLAAGLLPPELTSSTRKSLKAASIKACAQRFDPKDGPLLSSFFEPKENAVAYVKAIGLTSSEKFRTLNNFLNDRDIYTGFENICLLAWLIDFQPRPYHPGLKTPERPGPIVGPPIPPTGGEDPPPPPRRESGKTNTPVVLYVCLAIALTIVSYWVLTHKTITRTEHCMYWNKDHFEPISCNEKPADTTIAVLALDTAKLQHFKKITRADTLTAASIGKVWYANINHHLEFYTSSGQHPLYSETYLIPLTTGILNSSYGSR
jgi:hypothetical protein